MVVIIEDGTGMISEENGADDLGSEEIGSCAEEDDGGSFHYGFSSGTEMDTFMMLVCTYGCSTIRFSDVHSCGANVRTSKNPRVSSDLVSSTISEIVRDKPLTQPCEVVTILKRDYGLDVSYHLVWLGLEKAKAIIHGDHLLSFDQLRWYSDAVIHYNPESYVNIDYDASSQQFFHFFVSFATCIFGDNSCWPLLFLDGTFLKGKYKGQLLTATTIDRNDGLFHVAFAIVDSEITANWSWFLHELGKVVNGKRQITFISDRNLGLSETMPKVFPSAHHSYCLQHLKNNLKDWMKGINNRFRDHLVSSLDDYAHEPTVVRFHEKLEKLKDKGKQRVHNFFKDLAPEHWGNSYFRDMRYWEMTSNTAESFNNWIKEARNLPITQMVDTIRTKLIQQMSARRDQANKWNELICPTFKTMLLDSFNDRRSWQVNKANKDVFEVHSIPFVTVDIARRACSCFKWQINGFPCDYAVIAIQRNHYNLSDCVEHYFHVKTYRAAYSGVIFPIPSVEKPPFDPTDFTIYPLTVKRPPGRPKKNRILSSSEKLKQIRCGRCDKLGSHNRKSFKELI
ncbi:uncharacterized protein LOC114257311 [Camellia sinensis]|uniref:uncharacterized protein LOC114257311 n=1 Tax=Camellia sinensis TaxID=4442 RepID=UPI001035CACB|nr:uncharacterized protein LOC114257311 [Camellia sinensis]